MRSITPYDLKPHNSMSQVHHVQALAKSLRKFGVISLNLLNPRTYPKSETTWPSVCHWGLMSSMRRWGPFTLASWRTLVRVSAVGKITAAKRSFCQEPTQSVSSSHSAPMRPCIQRLQGQTMSGGVCVGVFVNVCVGMYVCDCVCMVVSMCWLMWHRPPAAVVCGKFWQPFAWSAMFPYNLPQALAHTGLCISLDSCDCGVHCTHCPCSLCRCTIFHSLAGGLLMQAINCNYSEVLVQLDC